MASDRPQPPECQIDELVGLARNLRAGRRPPPGAVERALSSAAALLVQLQVAGRTCDRDGCVADPAADDATWDITQRLRAAMRGLREQTRSAGSLAPWAESGFVLAREQERRASR